MQSVNGEDLRPKLYDDFDMLNRLTLERKSKVRDKMPRIPAWTVGGIVFLLWMSGVFAGSDTPSQTTSDPAQANTGSPSTANQSAGMSNSPEESTDGQSLHTHLVPHAALADLQQDSAAIEVQMSLARQLEKQLSEATSVRADWKAREHQLAVLIQQIDDGINVHNMSMSVTKGDMNEHSGSYRPRAFDQSDFNHQVETYNHLLSQVRKDRKNATAQDESFNELVNKVNAQRHLVNQMVDAYNAKLMRLGQ
jgi:uncharacterized protein involved in exopolysaccharide biosynthesis